MIGCATWTGDRLEPLARRWGGAGPDLLEDLRHGLRILRRGRAFTAMAVLTLALGIGANAAIFSIIDGVLLEPLPYTDPDRLVMLRIDAEGLDAYPGLSRAEVEAFRQETDVFDGLGTMVGFTVGLTAPGAMEQVPAVTVSPELFAVLGVGPVLGRGFDPQEDRYTENGAYRSVLISYELWQRRYGGEPDSIRRSVTRRPTASSSSRACRGVTPSFRRRPYGEPADEGDRDSHGARSAPGRHTFRRRPPGYEGRRDWCARRRRATRVDPTTALRHE